MINKINEQKKKMREENKIEKRDWFFWLLILIFVLGLILLIKILITGEPR